MTCPRRIGIPVVAARKRADIDLICSAVSPQAKCPPYALKTGHRSVLNTCKPQEGFGAVCKGGSEASNPPQPPLPYPRHQQHVNEPNYLQG